MTKDMKAFSGDNDVLTEHLLLQLVIKWNIHCLGLFPTHNHISNLINIFHV